MVSGGEAFCSPTSVPSNLSLAPLRAVSSPGKLADSEKCSQGAVKMAGAQ